MKLQRYIPQGYEKIKETSTGVAYKRPDELVIMFFIGRKSRPSWHERFQTEERMMERIERQFERLQGWEDMKAERKIKRKEEKSKFMEELKVGDIFYHSWGWEQTNIDFYQVTAIMGKKFELTPIARKFTDESTGCSMSGYVKPIKDHFLADSQIRGKMIKSGTSMEYGCLFKTDPEKSHYCSWYA